MSNTRYPDHHYNAVHKIPNHHYHHHYNLNQRNDSDDEIVVFEATKYFAAGASSIHQKSMLNTNKNNIRNQDDQPVGRRSRISLDSSPFRSNQSFSSSQSHRQKQTKDQKAYLNKNKQPVSPGGKLVSFLNSLFNQTSSSKKKKPTTSCIKYEDQESHRELGYGRRKRRSSISHFPSFNNNSNKITTSTAASISDLKSSPLLLYSSSLTSGFRTPPPFSSKTKMYQNSSSTSDLVTTSNQEFMFSNNLSKHSGRGSSISLQDQKMINRDMETLDVLYEKYKKINSLSEKQHSKDKDGNTVMRMRRRKDNDNQHGLDMDDDNGGESDSSSDLFELQNYDLCSEYCSVSGVITSL
ncbi:protein BIG GRAIN 1-like E [Papaver somniferum]|uniref:protein BIG GRAIN 1-like E n=1 Tax=Papaver somniferum TaxID=3469 RepID=UPI000E700E88|nr:protein BIG GRAIN 1-like E [Papaver somniferum]